MKRQALRVPQGWTGQDKTLIIQLENILNDLYRIAEAAGVDLDELRETKADKVSGAASGNFAGLDGNGNLTDSGHKHSDYITDISGKADKVAGATGNNFATLDASGNLKDSGHKHSDYITEHQDISGKADKVSGATGDNFAALDSSGNLKDSGHKHSDYLTEHQDISGKADKSTTVTAVTYDSTNKKLTKTINGTETDVVLVSTIKGALEAFTWGQLANQS